MFVFQAFANRPSEFGKKPKELSDFQALQRERKVEFTPEYKYREFFFTLPNHTMTGHVFAEQIRVSRAILSVSDSARVTIYVPSEQEEQSRMASLLAGIKGSDAKKFLQSGRMCIMYGAPAKSFWAQDAGETTGNANRTPALVIGWPSIVRTQSKFKFQTEHLWSSNDFPNKKFKVFNIPAVMEGGNITKAVAKDGARLVIIGINDVLDTLLIYKKSGYSMPAAEAMEIYRSAFGADRVLVLGGPERQPKEFFHIDSAVFFPKDGVAVLLKVEPDGKNNQVVRALATYKRQLTAAGFVVLEIPTTQNRIDSYMSYANAIALESGPGKSKITTILFPSFESPVDDGIENKIKALLEKEGFRIQFIKDVLSCYEGNIHCITGPFAYLDNVVPKKIKRKA